MGKSILSAVRLHHQLSLIVSSANGNAKRATTTTQKQPSNNVAVPPRKMEISEEVGKQCCCRVPLSHVVADCANRWFQDTLKEAKAGDSSMQLLVAQMYYSGYGVPSDPRKGNAWINKAARSRNSVWKGCDKHIGYRTSDSDTYEPENKAKFSP